MCVFSIKLVLFPNGIYDFQTNLFEKTFTSHAYTDANISFFFMDFTFIHSFTFSP